MKSLWCRRSETRVGEWAVMLVKQRNGWTMSCDVCKAMEGLENELWCWWSDGKFEEWAELILQPFRCFTNVTAHSPTLPSLYLRHSSFCNPSITSLTSQLILQLFRRFTYVTDHSPTVPLLHLRHSSFSNPSFACPRSQALHLIHLMRRPCCIYFWTIVNR